MSENVQEIRLIASLPMIRSAVNIGGDGSSGVKLEIPASELEQVTRLSKHFREEAFEVIIRRLQ